MTREEAINEVKKAMPTMWKETKEALNILISELAESEDERIRKVLIHIVKGACSKYGIKYRWDEITEEMLLTYLERQKEQTEELSTRLNGVMQEYVKSGKDEEEQEHRLKCYQLFWDALGDSEFFKQKPSGWSEEDEKMIDYLIEALPMWANGQIAMLPSQADEYVKKLKSLRPQPKVECSEEDKEHLDRIRATLLEIENSASKINGLTESQWVAIRAAHRLLGEYKSLRPQPHTVSVESAVKFGSLEYERGVKDGLNHHWKPSEEQIGALNYAYCELFKRGDVGHNILGPLQKLCDELNELM